VIHSGCVVTYVIIILIIILGVEKSGVFFSKIQVIFLRLVLKSIYSNQICSIIFDNIFGVKS